MKMNPAGPLPASAGLQPRPAAARTWPVTAASVLWALVPLATAGIGSWAVFLYAAIRRRSWWYGGAAAAYAAALTISFVADAPAHPGPVASAVAALGLVLCMLGGCAHALAVRTRVFGRRRPRADGALRHAEEEALRRRKLREEARALAAHDPLLARQLRIGRPDLRRDFDDGGLVDVNSAPAPVLAELPGMTPALAAKAVELRSLRGRFVSADDFSIALQMPPDWVPALADLTVYLG